MSNRGNSGLIRSVRAFKTICNGTVTNGQTSPVPWYLSAALLSFTLQICNKLILYKSMYIPSILKAGADLILQARIFNFNFLFFICCGRSRVNLMLIRSEGLCELSL